MLVKLQEAQRIDKCAGLGTTEKQAASGGKPQVAGTPEEIAAANSDDPATSRKGLERLLEKNPGNAILLGRHGRILSNR